MIASDSTPATIAAAERQQEYYTKVTGHRPPLWTDSEVRLEDLEWPVVILAGHLSAVPWAAELFRRVSPPDGKESFAIESFGFANHAFIVVRGNDGSGVRYGLHHLMELLEVDSEGSIRLPPLSIRRAPLVTGRILGLFWNGGSPPEQARKKNPENWPLEKFDSKS